MTDDRLAPDSDHHHAATQVADAIRDFVVSIPPAREHAQAQPEERARAVSVQAARMAALTAGSLALPPGPLGWVTILPEIVAVWRIQSQMIADIAGAYGKDASLNQEQMLYCLFRHSAAQAVRDLVVRVGERVLIRQASLRTTQRMVSSIGLRVTQRSISRGISRWLPVVGAVGVGAYAYYDTQKVAETAIELFSRLDSEQATPAAPATPESVA
jgi:hypothetical protein